MADSNNPAAPMDNSAADPQASASEGAGSSIPSTSLPLSRVRKLMKTDEEAGTISADAVFLATRATEMFVQMFAQKTVEDLGKRKTVQYKDVASLVSADPALEFLEEIIPMPVPLEKVRGKPGASGIAPGTVFPTNTPFVMSFASKNADRQGKHRLEKRDPRRDKKKLAQSAAANARLSAGNDSLGESDPASEGNATSIENDNSNSLSVDGGDDNAVQDVQEAQEAHPERSERSQRPQRKTAGKHPYAEANLHAYFGPKKATAEPVSKRFHEFVAPSKKKSASDSGNDSGSGLQDAEEITIVSHPTLSSDT